MELPAAVCAPAGRGGARRRQPRDAEAERADAALLRAAQRIVAESFAPDEFTVLPGDVELGRAFSRLPFDHLFFTGSTAVGRQIAQAAAENLTPVTLELGGKSPAIVDADCDLPEAARRIAFAKLLNAGQTCVAPDYLLVPRARLDAFVAALREAVDAMYPTLAGNPDYTSIVNDRHYRRLAQLVADAQVHGATAVPLAAAPADAASRRFLLTVLQDVDDEMAVMRQEIFGPLLPVLPYETLDDAIAYVNARPRPLALYWFGRDTAHRDRVLRANDFRRSHDQRRLLARLPGVLPVRRRRGERHGCLSRRARIPRLHEGEGGAAPVAHQRDRAPVPRPPYGRRFEAGLALLKRFF